MVYGRCKLLKDWNFWDNDVHADKEQIVRQARAANFKAEYEVDFESQTGVFASTMYIGFYDTSLSECSCWDFQTRGLPCKHIYRLAVELGYIEIIRRPTYNKAALVEARDAEDIDQHPDQIKRQQSAMDKKCTPVSVDYILGVGVFSGSGKTPYTTTVTTCTCRDYFVRRLPCKHIYRLRYELQQMRDD